MARDLPLAPIELSDRLRGLFTNPSRDGALTLRDLVKETYDLVNNICLTSTSNYCAHLPI